MCRIADLPLLYSHFGSRGVIPVTILQSYAQGSQAWGQAGMKTLWTAANIKLVGAGADDASFVADISRLVGDHDVPTVVPRPAAAAATPAPTPPAGRPHPVRRRRSAACAKGDALLLAAGCKPALLRLQPWYRSTAPGRHRRRHRPRHATHRETERGVSSNLPCAVVAFAYGIPVVHGRTARRPDTAATSHCTDHEHRWTWQP